MILVCLVKLNLSFALPLEFTAAQRSESQVRSQNLSVVTSLKSSKDDDTSCDVVSQTCTTIHDISDGIFGNGSTHFFLTFALFPKDGHVERWSKNRGFRCHEDALANSFLFT